MPKTLIISGHIGFTDYLDFVRDNHEAYARKHDYDYVFHSPTWEGCDTDNPIVDFGWVKVDAARKYLSGYEDIFWIDSDSIFANTKKSLEDLKKSGKPLVISGDLFDVFNTGHFFLKNTSFGHDWLSTWWSMRGESFPKIHTSHQDSKGRLNEQPAANILLSFGIEKGLQEISQGIQSAFNSINGFPGNPDRINEDFARLFAPNKSRNLSRTQSLLHPSLQDAVEIVPQRRINGYPNRQSGELIPTAIGAPIVHFAGSKVKLLRFAKGSKK